MALESIMSAPGRGAFLGMTAFWIRHELIPSREAHEPALKFLKSKSPPCRPQRDKDGAPVHSRCYELIA
jgi:hypothetical protein